MKRYSEEFKAQTVARVREGQRVKDVARACGCSVYSLRDWVKKAEVAEMSRPPTPEELAEIRRLKKQVRELEEQRDILKKATAFFAGEQQ